MRVLIALGGNAMTGPDGSAAPDVQRAAVERAMAAVADLV
ncbi:MAG: carbamate kinase, partial [Actinomycetota bacterium]|nr:carbamate kinase [Actinomycetota bacterium]